MTCCRYTPTKANAWCVFGAYGGAHKHLLLRFALNCGEDQYLGEAIVIFSSLNELLTECLIFWGKL